MISASNVGPGLLVGTPIGSRAGFGRGFAWLACQHPRSWVKGSVSFVQRPWLASSYGHPCRCRGRGAAMMKCAASPGSGYWAPACCDQKYSPHLKSPTSTFSRAYFNGGTHVEDRNRPGGNSRGPRLAPCLWAPNSRSFLPQAKRSGKVGDSSLGGSRFIFTFLVNIGISAYWPMERSISEWHDSSGKRPYLPLDTIEQV
jgi:hypothetical protein